MHRWVTIGLAAVLIAAGAGCKKRPVDEKAATEEAKESALVAEQAKTGKALEGLSANVATLGSIAAAQAAKPEFKEDLAVAKRLAGQLSRQAFKQQDKEAAVTVDRLVRCLAALFAGAPANGIQQHLERAEMGLAAGDLEGAGQEILAAAGAAYNPSAPALVPDVLGSLEQASEAMKAGDGAKAGGLISAVMEKTRADATADDLATAMSIAEEARVSVERKAWTILIAQATQIASLIDAVDKRSAPEAKAETPEAPAEAAPDTSTPATPAPAGTTAPAPEATKQPEGATSATPATGASAAKTGETPPQTAPTR
jgi:hypothetical protein